MYYRCKIDDRTFQTIQVIATLDEAKKVHSNRDWDEIYRKGDNWYYYEKFDGGSCRTSHPVISKVYWGTKEPVHMETKDQMERIIESVL